ncbi:MAG: hypothetical protein FWH35_06290 [Treponema sp.]|nr:hypothetical protein [Treponema sp.]
MRSNIYSPKIMLLLFALIFGFPVWSQTSSGLRSFDQLFPALGGTKKSEVFSQDGYIRSLGKNQTSLELIPAPNSGIDLYSEVMKSNPSYLAESLLVIPYSGKILSRLDAYNSLGKIGDLKGRLYHSFTKDEYIPLFEEATRLDSTRRNSAIPDPPPATTLPRSETVYVRLKDTNFGNSFYRADVSTSPYGVIYRLTNFRNISYLLFTVMKEEKFCAVLYLEPLSEGMLVYSMAGADSSDFIANKVHIPSAIEKRLAVFIDWVSDGVRSIK